MTQRVEDFWLLRDYLEGDVWSAEFYSKHKPDVIEILDSLDSSKEEVCSVISEFIKKGIYEKQYEFFEFVGSSKKSNP